MGPFDRVMITCPYCEKLTEFQSKSDKNMLLTYNEDHVPIKIALDLDGKTEYCDECHKPITCQSSTPIYGRLWAVKNENYSE